MVLKRITGIILAAVSIVSVASISFGAQDTGNADWQDKYLQNKVITDNNTINAKPSAIKNEGKTYMTPSGREAQVKALMQKYFSNKMVVISNSDFSQHSGDVEYLTKKGIMDIDPLNAVYYLYDIRHNKYYILFETKAVIEDNNYIGGPVYEKNINTLANSKMSAQDIEDSYIVISEGKLTKRKPSN